MTKLLEVEQFDTEFENVPRLESGQKIAVTSTEFGKTKTKKLDYVVVTTHNKKKFFTTGSKVIGQLRSDWYQSRINNRKDYPTGFELLVETVKAVPSGNDMLSVNPFKA